MRRISLQFLLLLLFLAISLTASLSVLYILGKMSNIAFHRFYTELVARSGQYIQSRITCLINEFEQLTFIGADIAEDSLDMSMRNELLISYFLNQLKDTEPLTSYYAGTPQGSYILGFNLNLAPKQLRNIPVPPGANYMILISNESDVQIRAFYDKDLQLLITEKAKNDFDPRTRPWYIQAVHAQKIIWTDLYTYYPTERQGISSAIAARNNHNEVTVVVGADLAVEVFSQFLTESKFSEHGKALILDATGHTLFPQTNDPFNEELGHALATTTPESQDHPFMIPFAQDLYLAEILPFPPSFGNHWKIAIALPRSDFFAQIGHQYVLGIMISTAIIFFTAVIALYISYAISDPIVRLTKEIDQMAELELQSDQKVASHISEINQIEQAIYSMRIALRSFSRYIPQEIAKRLMHQQHEIILGGERRSITIFFTDIANFTSISEQLPIETTNELLGNHFDLLSRTILDAGGIIDKYMGDGIMSLWGALQPERAQTVESQALIVPDPAIQACRAALLGQIRLNALNQTQQKAGLPAFSTRMGINTGSVIVGNFGTTNRMNFSVLGDAANIASRLQELNKLYGTQIIIGEETNHTIQPHFLTRYLDTVEVRGRTKKIKVFELLAAFNDHPAIAPTSPAVLELVAQYTEAVTAFEKGDREQALQLFTQLAARFPEDGPTQLHLNKIRTEIR